MKKHFLFGVAGLLAMQAVTAQNNSSATTQEGTIRFINQTNGKKLGYSTTSGVQILYVDGLAFKDLNKNGQLDPYEDWRLPYAERAGDLASRMSIDEIAGLMLYSSHQSVPAAAQGFGAASYNGKPFDESGALPSDLTDAQKQFVTDDNLRHILITRVASPEVAALWNNNVQELAESLGLGIPANNSSDPRHGTSANAEYNAGAGGSISLWPSQPGLAAAFDPEVVRNFGDIASKEYRALGIATALSPQIDLATEPRWSRFNGTFGEDPQLGVDLARAYCDGFQTTEANQGWGMESVNAMVKHWPGGGPEEGGRDGHFGYGAYAVYPGNNFETHLLPFTEGAFKLDGGTQKASAVMPYYTISVGQNGETNLNRGNSYNSYLITDLLRDTYNYDGVVCTDWGITNDCSSVSRFEGKCWGVENLTIPERHYELIKAGVDQFGGNNDKQPVLEAYQMGVAEFGEPAMRARMERSAERLLMNIFRTGLFENPYLIPAESAQITGNPDYMKQGYEAQLKSVVMLKNKNKTLPVASGSKKVYVPSRFHKATRDWWGNLGQDYWEMPVSESLVNQYYTFTNLPADADFALVFIESPNGGTGYSDDDRANGGTGYVPISLQYADYRADHAREVSLAGGSPLEDFTNRSYKGKSFQSANHTDAELVRQTRQAMGNKPVIVSVRTTNPFVLSEIEALADAILIDYEVQSQALLDVISGRYEPSGLLPAQMPASMETVELQAEDLPRDMQPYTDSEGNVYDFAYGLNWNGIIRDARVGKYAPAILTDK